MNSESSENVIPAIFIRGWEQKKRKFNVSKKLIAIALSILLFSTILTAHFFTHRKTHIQQTMANVSTTKGKSSAISAPQTQAPLNKADVFKLINKFYKQYIASSFKQSTKSERGKIINSYGTSKLIAYYNPSRGKTYAMDPILCAQAVPRKVKIINVNSNSYSSTGTVSEIYSTGPVNIKFTVVNQSESLKIDTLSCSPPLVAIPS